MDSVFEVSGENMSKLWTLCLKIPVKIQANYGLCVWSFRWKYEQIMDSVFEVFGENATKTMDSVFEVSSENIRANYGLCVWSFQWKYEQTMDSVWSFRWKYDHKLWTLFLKVMMGERAVLQCLYDMEGEELYSVKWYKAGHEFFRWRKCTRRKMV